MIRSLAEGQLLGQVNGTRAPNVLALHGWGRTHRDFDAVLAPMGEEPLDSIALDLAGFGVAPEPGKVWGTEEYAGAVSAILDQMATPVVVLGHSFGGLVAVRLALANPDRVGALVLTGVPRLVQVGTPPSSPLAFRVGRWLHRYHLVGESAMESMRQKYGSPDYRAAKGMMRAILVRVIDERYEEQLPSIGCPVTLVWGDDDTAAPLEGAEQASRLFPRAHLTVLPKVGHLTPVTAPQALRQAVIDNLASI